MAQNGHWILAVVVTSALLGGVMMLRHIAQTHEPEVPPVVPAHIPPRNKGIQPRHDIASQPYAFGSDEAGTGQENAPIVASDKVRVAPGTPAVKRAVPAPEPALQGRHDTVQAEAPAGEATGRGTPAEGVGLSVSFNGSASGADQSPPLFADGIEFDPTIGAAHFPPAARLAYPDSGGLSPDEGTVALWIRLEAGVPVNRTLLELVTPNQWENRLEFGVRPTYIGLLLTNSDGVEQGAGSSINWAPGEWHHVATSWGEALMSIYIDGVLADQRPFAGSLVIPPDTPLYVGSARRGTDSQGGTFSLRDLNLFQRALSADEIAMIASQNPPSQ